MDPIILNFIQLKVAHSSILLIIMREYVAIANPVRVSEISCVGPVGSPVCDGSQTNYEFLHRSPMRKLGWTEREARCQILWRFQIARRLTGRRCRIGWCFRGADRTPGLRSNAIRRRG